MINLPSDPTTCYNYACHPSCKGCTGPDSNACTVCDEINQNRIFSSNNCICKSGYYEDQNQICQACHPEC